MFDLFRKKKKFRKYTEKERLEKGYGNPHCICGHDELFEHSWETGKKCKYCTCQNFVWNGET